MKEVENCYHHQDTQAVGHCLFCGSPFCDECHEGPFCKFCLEVPPKEKKKALILAIFLGWLGVHRYYMQFYFTGVIYTFTFGVFGIGWAIDVIRIIFWSTKKGQKETLISKATSAVNNTALGYAISETIKENMSSELKDTMAVYNNAKNWRDKYGRPLLPIGIKSLK